jgi:bifunctional non-homologous end joining protein LigD
MPLPDARVSAPLNGMRFRIAIQLILPYLQCHIDSPQSVTRTQIWMLYQALSKDFLSLQPAMRRRAWETPRGHHIRKAEGEASRVAPSRTKSVSKKSVAKSSKGKVSRTKMPLLIIANSPSEKAAQEGLHRWKGRYPEAAALLAVDDVLVDHMRGTSSVRTRIRVNLRHVSESLRPAQETPDPDDDPTRSYKTSGSAENDK